MPYFWFTVMHWSRIDLPNASAPEIIAILVRLRFFMSSKIFSQAIRSVCGVLKFHFFTGDTACTAPAKLISGMLRLFRERDDRHRAGCGRAREQRVDLVLLDQRGLRRCAPGSDSQASS